MEPIGLLMKEHRIIERMVDALRIELSRERTEKNVNFPFLDTAIDFSKPMLTGAIMERKRAYSSESFQGSQMKKCF